jgi:Legionella pneumophila major outer membrane protein precursor
MVTYTQFDKDTFDTVSLPGTGSVIRSLVSHPNPVTAAGNGLDAAALHQTQLHIVDADYKGLAYFSDEWQIAYIVGTRFTNLEQHFAAGFAPATGFEEVLAEVEFDGAGLKLGLDGMRFHPASQFFFYGKGSASFVAGTFRAQYQNLRPTGFTDTLATFDVGRVVTILDMETGLGWQNFTGNLRFSMGYLYSAWYNTVRVNEFIHTVQTNNFADPSDNYNGLFTFDGLTAKVELLW